MSAGTERDAGFDEDTVRTAFHNQWLMMMILLGLLLIRNNRHPWFLVFAVIRQTDVSRVRWMFLGMV